MGGACVTCFNLLALFTFSYTLTLESSNSKAKESIASQRTDVIIAKFMFNPRHWIIFQYCLGKDKRKVGDIRYSFRVAAVLFFVGFELEPMVDKITS